MDRLSITCYPWNTDGVLSLENNMLTLTLFARWQHGLINSFLMGCSHDPANVQQTSSKCIQNTRANARRLLDRVNTPLTIESNSPSDQRIHSRAIAMGNRSAKRFFSTRPVNTGSVNSAPVFTARVGDISINQKIPFIFVSIANNVNATSLSLTVLNYFLFVNFVLL